MSPVLEICYSVDNKKNIGFRRLLNLYSKCILIAAILKPNLMLREPDPSAERIKQEIDINKENLKFLNSFYIPLLSAAITVFLPSNPMSLLEKLAWTLVTGMCLVILIFLKKRVHVAINKLIQKL
jgi:cytosine/uracil/thiamine/allantoin permease